MPTCKLRGGFRADAVGEIVQRRVEVQCRQLAGRSVCFRISALPARRLQPLSRQRRAGHDDAGVALEQPAAQKFRHVNRRGVQREILLRLAAALDPINMVGRALARGTPSLPRAIRPAAGCTPSIPARCPCPRSVLIRSLTASRRRWIGSVTLSFTSSARRMRSSVHSRRRRGSIFAAAKFRFCRRLAEFPRTRPRRSQKTCPTRSECPPRASPRCPCATWRAGPFSVRGFQSRFSA